jgi:hypothetical protein
MKVKGPSIALNYKKREERSNSDGLLSVFIQSQPLQIGTSKLVMTSRLKFSEQFGDLLA